MVNGEHLFHIQLSEKLSVKEILFLGIPVEAWKHIQQVYACKMRIMEREAR